MKSPGLRTAATGSAALSDDARARRAGYDQERRDDVVEEPWRDEDRDAADKGMNRLKASDAGGHVELLHASGELERGVAKVSPAAVFSDPDKIVPPDRLAKKIMNGRRHGTIDGPRG